MVNFCRAKATGDLQKLRAERPAHFIEHSKDKPTDWSEVLTGDREMGAFDRDCGALDVEFKLICGECGSNTLEDHQELLR